MSTQTIVQQSTTRAGTTDTARPAARPLALSLVLAAVLVVAGLATSTAAVLVLGVVLAVGASFVSACGDVSHGQRA